MKIGFVGLGLIGGSLAMLMREKDPSIQLHASSRTADTIDYALKNRVIDGTNLDHCDIVFICTPISEIVPNARKLKARIITDIGSVKESICDQLKDVPNFVGGHPMAGTEKTGIRNASADIVRGKRYLLTHHHAELEQLLKSLGFEVLVLSPQEHDRQVALASHLPYLMSSLALKTTAGVDPRITASGYRDTTRVAHSPAQWGRDICIHNKKNILEGLDRAEKTLTELRALIENGNSSGLEKFFD